MKQLSRKLLLLAAASMLIFACNDDEMSPEVEPVFSEDEAAEQVASIVISDIGSFSSDVEPLDRKRAGDDDDRVTQLCGGILYDTMLVYSYQNDFINYEFEGDYEITLECDGILANGFGVDYSASSSYEGVKLSSNTTTNGTYDLIGLKILDEVYTMDGSSTITGTYLQKEREQHTLTLEFDVTTTAVTLDKASLQIESGEMALTASGTVDNGETYTYTASVVFQGNQQALITINNEYQYLMDLENGEVTPQ